ncbi:MAG: GAF domain-containing sensor histidine kinase [Candidatus Dormibacteraeota bacterium]|nr:GAF domain-containing sensor histidine kinase [Candidatus Dormibacteraeota bacterium]
MHEESWPEQDCGQMSRGDAELVARHALGLLALAGDPDLDEILRAVLRSARALAGARYGALGIPDRHDGFDTFLTTGIDEDQAERIGELPRRHGVLGALLEEGRSIRLDDIRAHPRFWGYPRHHPVMTDFLGVPVRHRGEVLGNLYLSGSARGRFTERDEHLVETLAAYAGVAIANQRTYLRAQELALAEERARLGRDLHDAVAQDLFAIVLEARAAALQAPAAAGREALARLEEHAQSALRDMRGLVEELRPKTLDRDGLAATLQAHVEALRRTQAAPIEAVIDGVPRLEPEAALALLRIAQEALHNALRHAPGAPIELRLSATHEMVRLEVRDQGPGFDPRRMSRTERHQGLANMRGRAAAVGGRVRVTAAAGKGTAVVATVPASASVARAVERVR